MVKQIFVNLPVKDLKKTMDFFAALGFSFNPQFTNEMAASMEIGENIYAMLLTEPFFKTFTDKQIADASSSVEAINCLGLESRQQVDDMVNRAIAAGGKEPRPAADHSWMYQRSFEDLDGHLWEVAFMDLAAMPENPAG